jgi:hypothetical protein
LQLSWDEDSLSSFRIDFVLDDPDLELAGDFFSPDLDLDLERASGDFEEDFLLLSWEELELASSSRGL